MAALTLPSNFKSVLSRKLVSIGLEVSLELSGCTSEVGKHMVNLATEFYLKSNLEYNGL